METLIFTKGLLVGFFLCAPLGPIGLLCMRRTLIEGRLVGMASLLGASTVDAIYCFVAGLGITFISNFLKHEEILFRITGGLIFVFIGMAVFLSRPSERAPETPGSGILRAYASIFVIMLANPIPVLIFTAVFTALGVSGWRGAYANTAVLAAGVFVGAGLWAPILTSVVSFFRTRFTSDKLHLANKISGALIFTFGILVGLTTVIRQ
ncbi:MAG: LysE family transporter [Deltaproteobacteria bacterium]|nr:LysE family transporter [Deltaproteobacteria bacterium]MBW1919376.1 LysE family transporter [Deltaproteobacteria bacterium]MBW2043859.1 LysE family transporter [Deltaproteobacteria bacterium]MBW2300032.1 LysE family transporter [Deltaproteobacteria bacterium]RLB35156.1 MAG: LysE family translocator [Deltaproteobacteria bacterium]